MRQTEAGSVHGGVRNIAKNADQRADSAHLRVHLDTGLDVTQMLWASDFLSRLIAFRQGLEKFVGLFDQSPMRTDCVYGQFLEVSRV